jgi:hypothetical protein
VARACESAATERKKVIRWEKAAPTGQCAQSRLASNVYAAKYATVQITSLRKPAYDLRQPLQFIYRSVPVSVWLFVSVTVVPALNRKGAKKAEMKSADTDF